MAGESLSHSISERTTFSERFEVFPNVSNTGEYRFTLDAHAVTKLNKWLGWEMAFEDLYVSDPPPGIKKNDIIFTTGLRLTFGELAK